MDDFLLLDGTDFLLLDASGDRLLLGTTTPPDSFPGIVVGGRGATSYRRRENFVRPLRQPQVIIHDDKEIMAVIRRFLEILDR